MTRRWHIEDAPSALQLTQIANSVKWETGPTRTLGVARALYLPIRTGARVWSFNDGLVPADPTRFHSLLAR